jgi:MFS family permease
LQQTIVATALPTIVEHLGGGKNYSWVGRYPIFLLPSLVGKSNPTIFFLSSYLLAASALSPSYGKLSDLVGRKPVLYFAISSFLVNTATTIVYPPLICMLTGPLQ